MNNILKKNYSVLKVALMLICSGAIFFVQSYPFILGYGKNEFYANLKYVVILSVVMLILCHVWQVFAKNVYDENGNVRSDSAWNLIVVLCVFVAVILLLNLMFDFVYLDGDTPAFPSPKFTFSFRYIYELYCGIAFPLILLVARKEIDANPKEFNYAFVFSLLTAMTIAMIIIFVYYSGGGSAFLICMNTISMWFILLEHEMNKDKAKKRGRCIALIIVYFVIQLAAAIPAERTFGGFPSSMKDMERFWDWMLTKERLLIFFLGIGLGLIIKSINNFRSYKRYGEVYNSIANVFIAKSIIFFISPMIPTYYFYSVSPFYEYWAYADVMLLIPVIYTGLVDEIRISGLLRKIKECSVLSYFEGVDETVFMDNNSNSIPYETYRFIRTMETEYSLPEWEYVPDDNEKSKKKTDKKSVKIDIFIEDSFTQKGVEYLICSRFERDMETKTINRSFLVLADDGIVSDRDEETGYFSNLMIQYKKVYDYKLVKKALRHYRSKYLRLLKEGKYTSGVYKGLHF